MDLLHKSYGIFPYYGYEQQFMKLGNLGILL